MRTTTRAALAVLTAGALCALPGGAVRAADSATDAAARVAHYEIVERELLATDVTHLTPEQRAERTRAIRELRAYRERADFGVNAAFPGERRPYFVDDDGRHCAVAHLLHVWGEDELVADVVRTDNFAYVSDLAASPRLGAWLERVGISLREAARIQAPTIGGGGEDLGTNPAPDGNVPGSEAGPVTGGGLGGGATGRPTTGGGAGGAVGAESWWLWWEFNKLSFLEGNPLHLSGDATAGASQAQADAAALEARRRATLALLRADLGHADARVRAAAAIAVGRVGGPDAAPDLLPLLGDAQRTVREAAILGLGATGSADAAGVLLDIAARGTHEKRGGALSPDARGVALLALGVARRAGQRAEIGPEIARIVASAKKRDATQAGTGGMLYQRLAPTEAMDRVTAELVADRNAPDAARARAVEGLARNEEVPLRDLQRLLAGRDLELRRSAALALGDVEHELVAPRLQTAFELEKEPLTRGFVLLALGRQGGPDARTFLTRQLTKGDGAMKPWAALALGIAAREHDDDDARAALATAKLPIAQRGALWLARGLARDTEALGALSKAARDEKNPRTRAHAASALGLLGGDAARFALLSARADEESRLVRSAIAVSLGTIGASEDADYLLASMRDAQDPSLQGTLAVALGLHGGAETLTGLEKRLQAEQTDPATRATTIQALGILLDRRGGMVLPEVSSGTNYAVLPTWLLAALQTAL